MDGKEFNARVEKHLQRRYNRAIRTVGFLLLTISTVMIVLGIAAPGPLVGAGAAPMALIAVYIGAPLFLFGMVFVAIRWR